MCDGDHPELKAIEDALARQEQLMLQLADGMAQLSGTMSLLCNAMMELGVDVDEPQLDLEGQPAGLRREPGTDLG